MMRQHQQQLDDIVPKPINVGEAVLLPLSSRRRKRKIIYYHPGTGEPTCPLPADGYHMKLLLSRGFTLEPPSLKKPDLPSGKGECPICGRKVKRIRQHYNYAHGGEK